MKGLGLTNLGTDTNGNPLYMASADEDTSTLFEVGTDANGNAIFSTTASADASAYSQTSSGFDFSNFFDNLTKTAVTITSIDQFNEINRIRAKQGQPPLSLSQTNKGLIATAPNPLATMSPTLLLGAGLLLVYLITKR